MFTIVYGGSMWEWVDIQLQDLIGNDVSNFLDRANRCQEIRVIISSSFIYPPSSDVLYTGDSYNKIILDSEAKMQTIEGWGILSGDGATIFLDNGNCFALGWYLVMEWGLMESYCWQGHSPWQQNL